MSQNEISKWQSDWSDMEQVKIFIRERGESLKNFIVQHLLEDEVPLNQKDLTIQ